MESIWRWLCPSQIALDVAARNKRDALAAVASLCEQSHGLAAAPILRALWRREQAASTALGHGVAVPHARITGIEQPLTLFVRTQIPIVYDAPDRQPVSQLYVILVPAERDDDDHLKLLAGVAEMFADSNLRARVAQASTDAVVHGIFAEWVVHHLNESPAHGAPPSRS
jgi:nitrogen PTS system EIIA component